jgi:hypothetical protein
MNSGHYPRCIYSVWVTSLYQMDFRPKKRKKKKHNLLNFDGAIQVCFDDFISGLLFIYLLLLLLLRKGKKTD